MTRILPLIGCALLLAACSQPSPSRTEAASREGGKAPTFELKDLNGAVVRLADSDGTIRLVDFWTTWCAPCREEIPMFKDLHAAYGSKGFTLVGIAMDDEGLSVVKPFAEQYQIPYLTLLGTEDVAKAFGGVVGYPTKFLVDRDGKVLETWVGPVPRAVLEKKIQSLL